MIHERAELVVDDVTDHVGIDPEVLVDHDIAQAGDRGPGNVGVFGTSLLGQRTDRLAKDGEVPQDRVVCHRPEIAGIEMTCVRLAPFDRREHVGEPLVK